MSKATTKQQKQTAPGRVFIYKLADPLVTRQKVLQLARKFALSSKLASFTERKNFLIYKDGGSTLCVCRKSGAYRFINKLSWQFDDGKSVLDLQEGDAIKIAEKYINKQKIVSLKECRFLKIARLIVGEREVGADKGTERVIGMEVAFQRMIDKTPVDGPGGKVIVSIGLDSKVNGCTVLWRKIQKKYKPVTELVGIDFAIQQAYEYWHEDDQRITLEKTRFGYFEEGWKRSQKYLQPAHIIFVILGTSNSRFIRKSVYVEPAAVKNTGRITPLRKKRQRLPVRKNLESPG